MEEMDKLNLVDSPENGSSHPPLPANTALDRVENTKKTSPCTDEQLEEQLKVLRSEMHLFITEAEGIANETLAAAADEAQQAEQFIESLKTEMAALEVQIRNKEEALKMKDATIKGLEETLTAKIHELEDELKEKEQLLISRGAQIEEKDLLIKANADQNKGFREHLSTEVEKLRSELKEKQIRLAAQEKAEWRSLGRKQFWKRTLKLKGSGQATPTDEEI
ncbi:MAG: hypothetical protein ACE5HC_16670 [Candidatus Binatia bacterium]